jgi:predicted nucleic acid-binding Zn ribbon protein
MSSGITEEYMAITECDKCGCNLRHQKKVFRTQDYAYVVCEECKEKLEPQLEPIYGEKWFGRVSQRTIAQMG